MKKNNSIHLKLSTEIKNKLKEKASKIGLSLSSYCVLILSQSPDIQIISNK